ncbi:hypothetical protein HALLA_09665 [Halostagnicola larsenii XH-48]|uniref:Uncharacterized protein n=1 Tax=Halostagnicola larsenii XH-48 TaxID=797299 RepID=W0JP49_9EURY|nr:hypothetical protein [Halostagnicola larsenii]AHF99063.1 hypothetical protein HALLA_09500 [Halostagnicola larsenii XH-48]AHF99076.1 hypothetical protein HALLA_09665 [Halostagnicola larsenii XH-48]
MTERVEFGSKAAADSFREEHESYLCSDDDRRLLTVAISSSAPEWVIEDATIEAAAGRDEHGDRLDDEQDVDGQLAAVEGARNEQCGQARDYCEDGEDDACEFLKEACGFDDDEIATLQEVDDPDDLPGEIYGALRQLWLRYQIGIADAKEAAAAINEIHIESGRSLVEFEELGDRELTETDIDW